MKTKAELREIFEKEIKLPKGYTPEAQQMKYIQWLENRILEKGTHDE